MTKQELRKLYLTKRLALTETEYAQHNSQLYQNFLLKVDLSSVKVIHTFLPILSKKEPDTWPIIDHLRSAYPYIRISIPRVNNETGMLENFYFEERHQLATNEWGIQEPQYGISTEPQKIDLVLVPLLVCDQQGNRLGYGKGYYDKFLKRCRTDVKKIGISLFEPAAKIPSEPYDVKLSAVITPTGYREF
jgi:5-formyltetrahydrofolate cyclo-ligase